MYDDGSTETIGQRVHQRHAKRHCDQDFTDEFRPFVGVFPDEPYGGVNDEPYTMEEDAPDVHSSAQENPLPRCSGCLRYAAIAVFSVVLLFAGLLMLQIVQ